MSTVRNTYLKESITWEETTNPEYPYSAKINQDDYLIRLNDFPAESLYTLIVNHKEVEDFEDWPEQWIRTGDALSPKVGQTKKVRREITYDPVLVTAHPTDTRTVESAEIVRRIIAGDPHAEEEMVSRYAAGVIVIINRIVRNQSVAEDLSQEALIIILQKVRHGDMREPERLSGLVFSVARRHAFEYIRKSRDLTRNEEGGNAESIPDPSPTPFEEVLKKERDSITRQLINELKVERDREVLFRFYIAEENKEQICSQLGLTSKQFDNVIYRAKERYKELYIAIRDQTS